MLLRRLLGLASFVVMCPLAHADGLLFSFTETGATIFGPPGVTQLAGTYTVSFVLPSSSPTPYAQLPGLRTDFAPVDVTLNGTLYPDEFISFGSSVPTFGGVGGGCDSTDFPGCTPFGGDFTLVSEALFTGTTADPVFHTGSYQIYDSQFDLVGILEGGTQTLVISDLNTTTPEPSSLLLLGTGLLSALALKRRSTL